MFHDRRTGLLLAGDSLYPGRIYVEDWAAFVASVDRLVRWTREHHVSNVVGCHIEMSATGEDYPRGTIHQPDEPPAQMPVSRLLDLHRAVRTIEGRPGRHQFRWFQIWNG